MFQLRFYLSQILLGVTNIEILSEENVNPCSYIFFKARKVE